MKLNSFFSELASNSPAPGGGYGVGLIQKGLFKDIHDKNDLFDNFVDNFVNFIGDFFANIAE